MTNITKMIEDLDKQMDSMRVARQALVEVSGEEFSPAIRTGRGRRPLLPKVAATTGHPRRTMSAEAREKIAAAQKKRWAAVNQASKAEAQAAQADTVTEPAPARKNRPAGKKTGPAHIPEPEVAQGETAEVAS